jgi:hypothetical protein
MSVRFVLQGVFAIADVIVDVMMVVIRAMIVPVSMYVIVVMVMMIVRCLDLLSLTAHNHDRQLSSSHSPLVAGPSGSHRIVEGFVRHPGDLDDFAAFDVGSQMHNDVRNQDAGCTGITPIAGLFASFPSVVMRGRPRDRPWSCGRYLS